MKSFVKVYSLITFCLVLFSPQTTNSQVTFGPPQDLSLAANAKVLLLGDLDNDFDLDLLLANAQGLFWYENDGNGNFDTEHIIDELSFWDAYIEDIDNDGDMDIISGSKVFSEDNITWYENDGNGNFGSEIIIYNDINIGTSIDAADLDNDGDIDIVSAAWGADEIVWYENDGNSNFSAPNIIADTFNSAADVYAVDLDNDSDMDIVVIYGSNISWHENLANIGGSFLSTPQIIIDDSGGSLHPNLSIVDLNGDAHLDILSADFNDDIVFWHENDGDGNLGNQMVISTLVIEPRFILASDLDIDEDLDVISISFWDDKLAWYENDGVGNFGGQNIVFDEPFYPSIACIGDLDGDGDDDIIIYSEVLDIGKWFENLLELNIEVFENNPPCIGANTGSLQVIVSGLTYPPYNYEWSLDGGILEGSGTSEVENFSIEGLAAGTYDLMVINSLQDTAIQEGIVLEGIPGSIFEIIDITTTNSSNENPNGNIAITLDGGIPDYTFSWDGPDDGSVTNSFPGDTIYNLYAGSYSITVTDADNNTLVQEITLLDETVPGEVCDSPLDVIILNDSSGSVDAVEYEESKQFYVDLINSLNVGLTDEDTRVSIIEWSDTDEQTIVESFTGEITELQSYVNATRTYDGGTNPNDALSFAYEYLQEEGRPDVTWVIVLSTDGDQDQVSPSLIALSDEYQAEGVVIATIAFDGAFSNSTTQDILQQVANIDVLAPGAPAYSLLDQTLANNIANLYICTSDPGSSNTYYFNRDGAIEIDGYTPNEFCTDFSSIDIELTVTANQQLSLPAGTPITFYYNNPQTFAATPIITSYIPCALAAGESEILTYNLPVSGPANVYAVLNDDGAQTPPINFPITDIDELVWVNNVDQIEVCLNPFPTVSALKYTTTPQPICDTIVMYTIDVCNIGSEDAIGVEVEDVAPADFELLNISINDNGCAIGEGPFDLAVDCCVSLTYEYDASDAAAGLYNNQGVLLSGPPEQEYLNFDGSTTSAEDVTIGEILCESDVVLFSKEVNTTEICEESFVTYTFTITNETNVALQALTFTDLLPDPVIWAGEPYFAQGLSLGETDITNSNEANFTIAEIPADTIGTFYIDAYLGSWEESGLLANTATISNLSDFVNGDGADISANAEDVQVNALPIIEIENEITICDYEDSVSLSTIVLNGDSIQWLSGGDGSFSNGNSEATTYTFGEEDIVQGSVNLTISATTEECGESNVNVVIEIEECEIDCEPDAGIMDSELQYFCFGEIANVVTTDALVEDGSELWYILRDENGEIINSNQEGNFELEATNEIYHIAALVGPANDGNLPNIEDDCTVINEGTPFVQLEEITLEYNEECDPITEIYTLTMQVSGGLPGFDSNEYYSINGYYNDDELYAAESFQIIINDATDGTIIEFWANDVLDCQGYESIEVECIKLPIELLSFTGYAKEENNILEWQTAAEIDISEYTLERSLDGIDFKEIARINAKGSDSEYEYLDAKMDAYYRLKWEDGVSNVIQINRPNSSLEFIQYEDQIIIDESVQNIELVNIMGQIVASSNNNRILTGDLPSGVYLVKVLIGGEWLVRKIVL